jgi:cell division protein FtsL
MTGNGFAGMGWIFIRICSILIASTTTKGNKMNTHKITLTQTNGNKVLSRKDLHLEYPNLQAAANAASILHSIAGDSSQGDRVGRHYNITIEKI